MQKISVLITCYREGELIRRAFASLEAQTDQDFDVVIVNDGSVDAETNRICRELESQRKVRVVWHPKNRGLTAARNSGYEAMNGEICVMLDADDVLPPGAVANIREGFRQAPEADFVFGNYISRDIERGTEELVECDKLSFSDGYLDPRQLCQEWKLLGTSPCRKSAWKRIGGYAEAFSYDGQDLDFFMRLLSQNGKGYYLNQTIYQWNRSKLGMNNTVPLEVWTRVKMANIAFYDVAGKGIECRKRLMWHAIRLSDVCSAQKIARQLVRLRSISFYIVAIAVFPPNLTQLIYFATAPSLRMRLKMKMRVVRSHLMNNL